MITLTPFVVGKILFQIHLYPLPLMITFAFITPQKNTIRNREYPYPTPILTKTCCTNSFEIITDALIFQNKVSSLTS